MPEDRELWEASAAHSVRIGALEEETRRLRDRQHDFAQTIGSLAHLPKAMDNLAAQIERLSRRAIERPTLGGWQAFLATITTVIAVVALVVSLRH